MTPSDITITVFLIGFLAFGAGYILGTTKAETRAEQMRRWWYERERRHGR